MTGDTRRVARLLRRVVRSMLAVAVGGAVALGAGFTGAAPASAATAPPDSACTAVDVPVTALLLPATMHGTFCAPVDAPAKTVLVLVPGATYNASYWDFPYEPGTYNFRQAMNRAGFATMVVDRLGAGQSSRPLSAQVTASVQAAAVHEVISQLRDGKVDGQHFSNVILGGHSLGTAIAQIEASTYHDESAVLLTGWSHSLNLTGLANIFATKLTPAALDPAFAGKGYDPGYLTSKPGARGTAFYDPATTDPNVVAQDEATKDVLSAGEAVDAFGLSELNPYTDLIHVPVFLVDGQHDLAACGPLTGVCADAPGLRAQERPFFANSNCFGTYVLPDAGHDINLATNTRLYQQQVVAWADAVSGADAATQATSPFCS